MTIHESTDVGDIGAWESSVSAQGGRVDAETAFRASAPGMLERHRSSKLWMMREIRNVGSRSVLISKEQLDNANIGDSNIKLDVLKEGDTETSKGDADDGGNEGKPTGNDRVAVFNANSTQGCSIVRTLAKQGEMSRSLTCSFLGHYNLDWFS